MGAFPSAVTNATIAEASAKLLGRRAHSGDSMTCNTSQSDKSAMTLSSGNDEVRGFEPSISTTHHYSKSPDVVYYYEKSLMNQLVLDDNKVHYCHPPKKNAVAPYHDVESAVNQVVPPRMTRPLMCPSRLDQKSTVAESNLDDAAWREQQYDNATWRMYYRIIASRQAREQSSLPSATSSAVPARHRSSNRTTPISDDSTKKLDECHNQEPHDYVHNHHVNATPSIMSSDYLYCYPPSNDLLLSSSLQTGIFEMEP